MNKDDLSKILEAAVKAPSGENCQPWRFIFKEDVLYQYNMPERDRSPYNFRQFGSLVSHGAVIENIIIAAAALGYQTSVSYFPSAEEPDCVAMLSFAKDASLKDSGLYKHIFTRASNRTDYDPHHLIPETVKENLAAAMKMQSADATLVLIDDSSHKHAIAEAMSYGDQLLFINRTVHDFLFAHIFWTLNDAEQHLSGFYIKELALKPPQEFVFKLLRSEPMRRFLKRIGLPKVAAKDNTKLYESSSALGAIIVPGNAPDHFIDAGRALQRLWLSADEQGYDMQLITAIPFFAQRVFSDEAGDFTENEVNGIKRSYEVLAYEFRAGSGVLALAFRIGKGKPLSHRSFRMAPLIR